MKNIKFFKRILALSTLVFISAGHTQAANSYIADLAPYIPETIAAAGGTTLTSLLGYCGAAYFMRGTPTRPKEEFTPAMLETMNNVTRCIDEAVAQSYSATNNHSPFTAISIDNTPVSLIHMNSAKTARAWLEELSCDEWSKKYIEAFTNTYLAVKTQPVAPPKNTRRRTRDIAAVKAAQVKLDPDLHYWLELEDTKMHLNTLYKTVRLAKMITYARELKRQLNEQSVDIWNARRKRKSPNGLLMFLAQHGLIKQYETATLGSIDRQCEVLPKLIRESVSEFNSAMIDVMADAIDKQETEFFKVLSEYNMKHAADQSK